jgi:formate-dependent nitrite reductase membrane component NrfD
MLIAPTKLHPLWYTPILPLLFLTSAIAIGYPMVVFETTLATTSLKLDPEMHLLSRLTRITLFCAAPLAPLAVHGLFADCRQGAAQPDQCVRRRLPPADQ